MSSPEPCYEPRHADAAPAHKMTLSEWSNGMTSILNLKETLGKMPMIECGYFAAAFQSRRRYDDVIISNHLAGSFQFHPNAGVFVGRLFRVGNDRQ